MPFTIRRFLAILALVIPLTACSSQGADLPVIQASKTDDANYRPFYIYGEVKPPGTYPYASGMRVVSAVATAGGYTYRANENYVVISRHGVDRKALPDTAIEPNDVIKVPERYF